MAYKVFISVPMLGRTDEEISITMDDAKRKVKNLLADFRNIRAGEIEFIETHLPIPEGKNRLWALGRALQLLSEANLVFFCDGWTKSDGCCIEHEAAIRYGISYIDEQHSCVKFNYSEF